MFYKKRIVLRQISVVILIAMIFPFFAPIALLAVTSGPTQPEYSGFSLDRIGGEQVDPFTGAFSYSIPLLEVPGTGGLSHPITLSYSSGSKPDQDASWVGFGWNLNSGAIVREVNGYPDDYNGDKVIFYNDTRPNITASVNFRADLEALSFDSSYLPDSTSIGANVGLRYNNHRGYAINYGFNINAKGLGSMNLGMNGSDGRPQMGFNFNPSPGELMSEYKGNGDKDKREYVALQNSLNIAGSNVGTQLGFAIPFNSSYYKEIPSNVAEMYAYSVTAGASFRLEAVATMGLTGGFSGNYTYQRPLNLSSEKSSYGYIYSANATSKDAMMDYSVEKSSNYSKRDLNLGIPFSNFDNFVASGPGIAGTFRFRQKRAGHFRPNYMKSTTIIGDLALDFGAGILSFATGGKLSGGNNKIEIKDWNPSGLGNYKFKTSDDESVYPRITNDGGGSVTFSSSPDIENVITSRFTNNNKSFVFNSNSIDFVSNGNTRTGRARNISWLKGNQIYRGLLEYDPNENVNAGTDKSLPDYPNPSYDIGDLVSSFKHHAGYLDFNEIYDGVLSERINELTITNQEGNVYNYGLPVYSRNERNITYFPDYSFKTYGNPKRMYKNITPEIAIGDTDTNDDIYVVGSERNAPYASQFLLTSITSPDYIDRLNDGPSSDDMGGWIKYSYTKTAGTKQKNDKYVSMWDDQAGYTNDATILGSGGKDDNDAWYKWRMPYCGLSYERNELSNSNDDAASFSMGEKELYYMEEIETKTHVAKFFVSSRDDAYEANHNEYKAAGNVDEKTMIGNTANKSRKLDRIELYAKNDEGGGGEGGEYLLQTVYFEYDYSISPKMINSKNDQGKLTLKKVWTEYEDIRKEKIEPYIFSYKYETHGYPEMYSYLDSYHRIEVLNGSISQSPWYNPLNSDRWGNYSVDDMGNHWSRLENENKYVNQSPDEDFDVAAWQLKQIREPSGSEIHVHYEQNTYSYVHAKPALAMAEISDYKSNYPFGDSEITLDLKKSFGVNSKAERDKIISKIQDQFVDGGEKMYFKMQYELTSRGTTNMNSCLSDFISGYSKVLAVGGLSGADSTKIKITFSGTPAATTCLDFVKSQKAGMLSDNNVCDRSQGRYNTDMDALDVLYGMAGAVANVMPLLSDGIYCGDINEGGRSWLRIPLAHSKLGGGIRTKRVLKFDKFNNWFQNAEPTLYGKEYIYEDANESFGVATAEPPSGSEESALILPRKQRTGQSWYEEMVAGKDLLKFEGFYGETLLGASSVGYSKVVEKNIFGGASSTGFAVHQFYTVKNFPYDKKYKFPNGKMAKAFDWTQMREGDQKGGVELGIFGYENIEFKRAQGYRFILHNLHGKKKSYESFGGNYSNEDSWYLSQGEYLDYYVPGELVPYLENDSTVNFGYPGLEEEIIYESKEVAEESKILFGNFDAGIQIIPFIIPFAIPIPGLYFGYNYKYNGIKSHVTTKILRFDSPLKSKRIYKDGIQTFEEITAYDPRTGDPVINRSTDGYDGLNINGEIHDGSIFSQNIPAYEKYPEMGHKYKRSASSFASGVDFHLYFQNANIPRLLVRPLNNNLPVGDEFISEGDQLRITNLNDNSIGYFIAETETSVGFLLSNLYKSNPITDVLAPV
jgi:hypothetical protein